MKASEWLPSVMALTGPARAASIMAIVRTGNYVLDFEPLKLGELTLMVSADALRIGERGDSVRVAVSAYLQQQLADMLGCVLPTQLISDEIFKAADNRLQCYTQQPCKCTTEAFVRHSEALDRELDGRPGISTAGKDWVLSRRCTLTRAANYGWPRPDGSGVWQPLGTAHGLYQDDYSQLCRLVRQDAMLSGETVDVRHILVDHELAPMVSYEGALPSARQPGVPYAGNAPEPAPVPWQDTLLTLGERAIQWSLSELERGACERPLGSNAGPDVRAYMLPATRLIDGFEAKLGLTSGNWCAASACAAAAAATMGDDAPPHGYRVSGLELERDAKASGAWRSAELVRSGEWSPELGDLCILDRGKPGSWQRHVCRVYSVAGNGHYSTIGGNEGHMWRHTERRYGDPELLGFIEYPRAHGLDYATATRLLELSRASMQGEPELAAIMAELDEQERLA